MTNVNTKPAKHMHLRYMQNILYTIRSQLLYAKDYMKSHWPITLTKDKFKRDSDPTSLRSRAAAIFPFRTERYVVYPRLC